MGLGQPTLTQSQARPRFGNDPADVATAFRDELRHDAERVRFLGATADRIDKCALVPDVPDVPSCVWEVQPPAVVFASTATEQLVDGLVDPLIDESPCASPAEDACHTDDKF